MIKTHTFNRRKYLIDIDRLDGMCNTYKKERELHIFCDLATQKGLETAIHEALHACKWNATEKNVEITAKDIARFLWRLGYRLK